MRYLTRHRCLLSLPVVAAAVGMAAVVPAQADPLPYGPDTCISGYVWREAGPGDHVCVKPEIRDSTARENADPDQHRQPGGGAYGPDTCAAGYVWREAFSGDHVCVSTAVRNQASIDNAKAENRYERNAPLDPFGPGGPFAGSHDRVEAHQN